MTKFMVRLSSDALGATPPNPNALAVLMDEVRRYFPGDSAHWANDVPFLLDKLRGLDAPEQRGAYFTETDVAALGNFVADLRVPLDSVGISGLLGDPWSAAALRRDEVRHASVLRWFLDPRGGHGCGDALLTYVLTCVGSKPNGQFPARPSTYCSVTVEECPNGDRGSRIDIQINDPDFFLVVEVKINAAEQPSQVERYCDIAAAQAAGMRPWAVVFVTTDGRAPTSAGHHIGKVVSISWNEIASALRRTVRNAPPIPRFLARTFATHIDKL